MRWNPERDWALVFIHSYPDYLYCVFFFFSTDRNLIAVREVDVQAAAGKITQLYLFLFLLLSVAASVQCECHLFTALLPERRGPGVVPCPPSNNGMQTAGQRNLGLTLTTELSTQEGGSRDTSSQREGGAS